MGARAACLVLLLLLLSPGLGCATTRIVESWTAPGLTAADIDFQHMVALAVVPGEARQRIAEDALAAAITDARVTPAYALVGAEERADASRLREALGRQGVDGVLGLRLIGVEAQQTYVPPTTRRTPGGYYGHYERTIDAPGYTRTDRRVTVEISLHDVERGELLWAGVSDTLNPSGVDALITEIVEAASRELRAQGLLP